MATIFCETSAVDWYQKAAVNYGITKQRAHAEKVRVLSECDEWTEHLHTVAIMKTQTKHYV
jgi:hypothetical protein